MEREESETPHRLERRRNLRRIERNIDTWDDSLCNNPSQQRLKNPIDYPDRERGVERERGPRFHGS